MLLISIMTYSNRFSFPPKYQDSQFSPNKGKIPLLENIGPFSNQIKMTQENVGKNNA